ncbi:MAG TPA: ATP-binding protein [Vicinamibacterales bacterium]|nr:ATP-binding protein [Vicinamibacterales bacterium]
MSVPEASLFGQLADNIKEALVVVDLADYRPRLLNKSWEDMWGRSAEEAMRDPQVWIAGLHPDDMPAILQAGETLSRGEPVTQVFRVVRPDESQRLVRARCFPVRDADGGVYRFVGLVEDITSLRRMEDQLRGAQRMDAVGRLAGGIAHDFNNALTSILGYAELVLSDLGPSHPSSGRVEAIRSAGHHAANLTRQLLAFSRRQILQPRDLDLNELVQRIEPLLKRVTGEDIDLSLRLTTPLSTVRADPGQIEQVVMNLVLNARDAMPNGGRLTIETAHSDLDGHFVAAHPGSSTGRHVLLVVTDTGAGMDEETRRRLFEPFFTTKGVGKGPGLGLSTAYGIVKQSRGSIWVYSEPGQGASFKIYLPVVTDLSAVSATETGEPEELGGAETVLLVEDQADVRSIVVDSLRPRGYTVLAASDGCEAVEVARTCAQPIDVLLTDVIMPGLGGRDVAYRVRALRPSTRVVFMSGYTDDAVVERGMLEQGAAFLQKPFTSRALLQKIRAVLDGRG